MKIDFSHLVCCFKLNHLFCLFLLWSANCKHVKDGQRWSFGQAFLLILTNCKNFSQNSSSDTNLERGSKQMFFKNFSNICLLHTMQPFFCYLLSFYLHHSPLITPTYFNLISFVTMAAKCWQRVKINNFIPLYFESFRFLLTSAYIFCMKILKILALWKWV